MKTGRKLLHACLLCLLPALLTAQDKPKYTLSGYIKDAATNEASIGASVGVKGTTIGTVSDVNGFYSLSLEEGTYTIVINYVGFGVIEKQVEITKNTVLNFGMKAKTQLKTVKILADRPDHNVSSTEMGTVRLDMSEIEKIPAFMGEVDVLKTVQLLPGVTSAGDGNAGFYVRGGGPDQNLILMDGATVYNAAHLLGFFSVFNGNAVGNMKLYKGGMPAKFGGRLASVLDITMKDGSTKDFHANGGIGLIASRLTVEGPIKKDTSSFIVSARRTYIDALVRPFGKEGSTLRNSGYYFYDVNGKGKFILSKKDRLFVSGYYGKDLFLFKDNEAEFNIENSWGNGLGVIRWNHMFSDKLTLNTSAILSDYKFSFDVEQTSLRFKLFSGIQDWSGKVAFSYFPTIRHDVNFGADYTYHIVSPISAAASSGDVEFDLGEAVKNNSHEMAIYLSDDYEVTPKLNIHAGLRYSYFMQVGPFTRFITDSINTGQVIDSVAYGAGDVVQDYGGLEPRFNMRYSLNDKSSIKAAYTYNLQYIHLASLSSLSLPSDTWTPSSELVKPQKGSQYSVGYFRNFKDNAYESSIEVYYKEMKNQIEYKEGTLPSDDVKNNADNQFTFGRGWAYGAEFFFKKRFGKLNGWVGYTLSYTKRQFDEVNLGREYFAKYDRRHDVSLAANYELSDHWTLSAVWVYGTGNAITVPVAYYFIDGNFVTEYGARNDFRMPAYHRLDISATYKVDRTESLAKRLEKKTKRYKKKGKDTNNVALKDWYKNYESSWNFSVYNVYNRHNPYIVYFASEGSVATNDYAIQAKQMYLFPILPSVTWNFKF